MEKILFVSVSDVCRAPVAALLMNKHSPLARSAGIDALDGSPLSDGAIMALEDIGISAPEHLSATLRRDDAAEAAAIICVTKYVADIVKEAFPEFAGKVTAISPDVPDPYGGDMPDYRRAIAMLREYTDALAQNL